MTETTTASDDLIGRRFEPFTFTVERAKVEELRDALGLEGEPSAVAPLTFLNSSMQTGITGVNPVEGLGLSRSRVLHAGQELRLLDVVYLGDVLTGQTVVSGITEKQGRSGALRFYDLETTFSRAEKPVVVVVTRVAERLGASS